MRKYFLSLFVFITSFACIALSTNEDLTSTLPIEPEIFLNNLGKQENRRALQEHPTPAGTTASGTEDTHQEHEEHEEVKFTPDQPEFWFCVGMATFLVCFAGAMSGLTVGYLSIDQLQLELKMKNGTDEDKADARVIIPILEKHHLLMSTLLVANGFAMEALPLFLDAIMPAVLAVIFSTSCVVIFGEIVPQAYCTGPQQIKIARKMAPLIKLLELFFYPICYPISVGLDKLLGIHSKTRFVKADLKALIELHKIDRSGAPKSNAFGHESGHHEIKADAQLTADEIRVINSTIDLRETSVTKEMERIEKLFMLSNTTTIDSEMVKRITKSGYSKVPIYKGRDRNNIIGVLKAKSLINYERYEGKTIEGAGIQLIEPLIVAKDTSMLEMLMLFEEKRTSIALISDESVKDKGGNAIFFSRRNLTVEESKIRLIGLISLKDIFEEILESKMADDDVHGAVTLYSGQPEIKRKFKKAPLGEIEEASERPEKGLKKPLLEY